MTQKEAHRSATMLGLVVALFGIPAVTFGYRQLVGESSTTGQVVTRELVIFALLAGLLAIIRHGERKPLSSISLGGGRLGRSLLWGLAAFALLAAGTALSLGLLPLFGLTYGGSHAAFTPPLWATAIVVLRAGIVEEIFYRGYAIERIQALTGSRIAAGAVPLIAFATFHFRGGIAGILIALILGLILTVFYLWRRNLVANITGHFLTDFIPNVLLPALGA